MERSLPVTPGVSIDLAGPEAIERRLSEASQARRLRRRLAHQLADAVDQVEEADAAVEHRRQALVHERSEVAELTSLSFTRFIAELHGTLDERMRREITEANAAHWAVTEAEHRREEAVRAMSRLQDRIVSLGDVDAAWSKALADKEQWITAEGAPASDRLVEIAARRGEIEAERQGVAEATSSASGVQALLDDAQGLLEGAQGWSVVDALLEGGVLTTSPRQRQMDLAAEVLLKADDALDALQRVLGDLLESDDGVQDLTALHDTCGPWFQAGLAEGSVAEQVQGTLDDLARARACVDRLTASLDGLRLDLEAETEALRTERATLLGPAQAPEDRDAPPPGGSAGKGGRLRRAFGSRRTAGTDEPSAP